MMFSWSFWCWCFYMQLWYPPIISQGDYYVHQIINRSQICGYRHNYVCACAKNNGCQYLWWEWKNLLMISVVTQGKSIFFFSIIWDMIHIFGHSRLIDLNWHILDEILFSILETFNPSFCFALLQWF